MSKKTKIIVMATAGVVVLAIIASFVFKSSPKAAFNLETATITTGGISTSVTATGTIEPITKVEVGTQVSGKIAKIYVDYNSVVKAGDVLAEVDRTNLQTEYNTQTLSVQSSKTEYEYQKKNFERSKQLHEQNLISDTDFESAKYSFEKAESTYKQNISNLDKTKTNLGYATIYSPIDGVVLSRAVEEGQTVAASFSTPTMFVIAKDLTKMQVVANVDEADIGSVKEGQHVTFMVDAYPEDIFDGTVTQVRLNPTTTSNVVTYQVIVNAPNPDLKLKPGLTANITIYTVEKRGVQVISNQAFNFRPDTLLLSKNGINVQMKKGGMPPFGMPAMNEKLVWVKTGNNLEMKKVTTGETDGVNTEILSGIGPKDTIVLSVKNQASQQMPMGGAASSPFMPGRPGGVRR